MGAKNKLAEKYRDPAQPGNLGGIERFAKAQKVPVKKVQAILRKELGYTPHKPRRRRYPTLPFLVIGIDEQWICDLVEVQNIAKQNKGMRYLLMAIDAFSKYASVEPTQGGGGFFRDLAMKTLA